MDAVSMTLEWSRLDLNPKFVHVRRDGEAVPAEQNPAYTGRTSVSTENLKHGDLSLKLSTVELSDSGTYRCYVPEVNKTSVISLSVGQSQVIAPSHPTVGNNIILPKDLNPAVSPVFLSLEWSGPDLTDISLKRSRVELSEDGSYWSYNNSSSSLLLLISSMGLLTDERSFRDFIVRLFHHCVIFLLLAQSSAGHPMMIGSLQPIKAVVGEDVILPCHLESAMNIVKMTIKWMRSNLDNQTVLLWQQDLKNEKHQSYKERTSLFIDKLKQGDILLKLSKVKLADQGKYVCYI
ncbi:hypothetical protein ABVT39_007355 [Epinephelus coioides]